MRPLWFVLLIAGVVSLVVHLARFGHEEVDRVEVHAEGAPPLLLKPGNVSSLPWSPGSTVLVAAFIGETGVCEGTVADVGMGLTYRQRSQTKTIEADQRGSDIVELSLVNVDMKTGTVTRQLFLRLERKGQQLVCAFPAKPGG